MTFALQALPKSSFSLFWSFGVANVAFLLWGLRDKGGADVCCSHWTYGG